MSSNAKIDLLKTVPLFAECSKHELEQIARLVDQVTFPAGKVAIHEGEPLGLECIVVIDGRLEVSRGGEVIAELGPGDIAGEMSLLELVPRSASVTAATDVEALVMDPRSFNSLMDDVPRVAEAIAEVVRKRHA
ncbi:MAG TPA: cyclic nucleotide-binding domain-containing protein [Actinomycetota bacterium]|nr:cyclic nucleotide-binding domain-containing protein [Actinomycetota bacterium]